MSAHPTNPRQRLTTQSLPTTGNNQQQQQQQLSNAKKKKKSHGNRKEQHRRRRIRRHQQMNKEKGPIDDDDVIIIEDDNENQIPSLQQRVVFQCENKRKRHVLTPDDPIVTRSFSQLSVSQETPSTMTTMIKKKTKKDTNDQSITTTINSSMDVNHMDRLKSEYLRVSNVRLKQMLIDSTPNGDKIISYLDSDEKIQAFRQILELSNQLQYLELQEHLWKDYYNLGIKEGHWGIRVSKSYAKHHGVCRSYGYPRHIVEKRQQNLQCQTQKITVQLQQLLQQVQRIFDLRLVLEVIDACVQKGQQRLREELNYRRQMLVLNAKDHDLLKKFYQLQLDHEDILLAKKLWQSTTKAFKTITREEILRKRIHLRRLPKDFDTKIDGTTSDIESLLNDPSMDMNPKVTLASNCSKAVTQYKFDLMSIELNALQAIRLNEQRLLADLRSQLQESSMNDAIKLIVEERIHTMNERHNLYLKYTLQTFFDNAPTAAKH